MPDDLLSALAPPSAEAERPIGLIDGPPGWHEGLGAGLRCWCEPVAGWRVVTDRRAVRRA